MISVSKLLLGLVTLNIALGAFRHIIVACSRDHHVQILILMGRFVDVGWCDFSVTKARGTREPKMISARRNQPVFVKVVYFKFFPFSR